MLPVLGFIALGGAVLAAGACVLNSLSDDEKRRQEKLKRNYQEYKEKSDQEYRNIASTYRQEMQRYAKESQYELWRVRQAAIETRKAQNADSYAILESELNSQIAEWEKMYGQVQKAIETIQEGMSQKHNQSLRGNSMKEVRSDLIQTSKIQRAYIGYLKKYQRAANRKYDRSGELTEPFLMRLPEKTPFIGKLMTFHRDQLLEESFHEEIHDGVSYLFVCEDRDFVENHPDMEYVSCLVTARMKKEEDDRLPYLVNCSRGIFMQMLKQNPLVPLEAEIIEVREEDGEYILDYKGVPMTLKRRNTRRYHRRLNLHEHRSVFVMDYDRNTLSWIQVTEWKEQCLRIESFTDVSLFIKDEDCDNFIATMEKKGGAWSEEGWYIGPMDQNQFDPAYLKFQLGRQVGFCVAQKNVAHNDEQHFYLEFAHFLPDEEMFQGNDSFVALHANLKARHMPSDGKFDGQNLWGGLALTLYVNSELLKQAKMKENRENILFFNQWSVIMDRLVEEKESVNHISIHIEETMGQRTLNLVDEDRNTVGLFYQKALRFSKKENIPLQFYVRTINGRKYRARLSDDFSQINLKDELHVKQLEDSNYQLELHQFSNPYPERQQQSAMNSFLRGDLADVRMRDTIFDLTHLSFNDSDERLQFICNSSILQNQSQLQAVIRAVAVRDFFMIQGPPGTGKTTVIKELIWQQLQSNPSAKILVVSQANVAVDNVLQGLPDIGIAADHIVRCGQQDKMSERVQEFSLEHRIDDYHNKLYSSPCEENLQGYRELWRRLLERNKENNLIGEDILNVYPIIGATCVGLAQKHFGLDRMEFDLVIIDEAGKALPGELLLPINRAHKIIMIGDHKQLPPVIDPTLLDQNGIDLSDVIEEEIPVFFDRSLFRILFESCPETNRCMLDTQFRMPPMIGQLVSRLFYGGSLVTGDTCSQKKPLFFNKNLVFINMDEEQDYHEHKDPNERSGPYNPYEITATIFLLQELRKHYQQERIVVITPYKRQMGLLRKAVKNTNLSCVDVNTIDAFQGDESDIVIYCMTRSQRRTRYFSDYARLNVAFSRTKNMLIIIGALKYLKSYPKDHALHMIAEYLQENKLLVSYSQLCKFTEDDWAWSPLIESSHSGVTESLGQPVLITDTEKYLPQPENIQLSGKPCKICGQLHDEVTLLKGVCSDCLHKSEHYPCHHCHQDMEFSNFNRYVLGEEKPELCPNCVVIDKHLCIRCKTNEVTVRGADLARRPQCTEKDFMYCYDCMKERRKIVEIGSCQSCGATITMKKGEVEDYAKKGWGVRKFCKECKERRRQEICIGTCKECGKTLMFNQGKVEDYEKSNRILPQYCMTCHNRSKEEEFVGYCCDCQSPIYMTRGERRYYEQRGLQFPPKRCKNCKRRY